MPVVLVILIMVVMMMMIIIITMNMIKNGWIVGGLVERMHYSVTIMIIIRIFMIIIHDYDHRDHQNPNDDDHKKWFDRGWFG